MKINRERYYKWAWLIDLIQGSEKGLGGLSERREKLYATAFSFLGIDASPRDIAPDDFGCAESLNEVYKAAFGHPIGGDISTTRLYAALMASKELLEVDSPLPGDIIISPTGFVKRVPVGHVGIVGKWQIMSNNSVTGKWDVYYTQQSWRARYDFVRYFRCIEIPDAPPEVAKVTEQVLEVSREAAKYPVLHPAILSLLAKFWEFLSSLKTR